MDIMEGMKDWNKMTTTEYIEHLESKFIFDSSGTAKAVFELIAAYKALSLLSVSDRFMSETKLGMEVERERMSNNNLNAVQRAKATGKFLAIKNIRDGIKNGYYNVR